MTTEEHRCHLERRRFLPERRPYLWRPLGSLRTWGGISLGRGRDDTGMEVGRRLRFQNTYTLRTLLLRTAEQLLCAEYFRGLSPMKKILLLLSFHIGEN